MVDVDGTLCDFTRGFRAHAARYGPVSQEHHEWAFVDIPKATTDRVWAELKADPEWWLRLGRMDDFRDADEDALTQLAQDAAHDVYFVTARVGIQVQRQTKWWLEDQMPRLRDPNVIVVTAPALTSKVRVAKALGALWSIEDKLEHAVGIAASVPRGSYLIDRPWNRGDHAYVTRVATVSEFIDAVRGEP
jgi:uncharacterized HAD superfamily protein